MLNAQKNYLNDSDYKKYYKIANQIFPGKFKEILIISFKKRSDETLEQRIESYKKLENSAHMQLIFLHTKTYRSNSSRKRFQE